MLAPLVTSTPDASVFAKRENHQPKTLTTRDRPMTDDIFAIADPLEPSPLTPPVDWQRAKAEVDRDAYRIGDADEALVKRAVKCALKGAECSSRS